MLQMKRDANFVQIIPNTENGRNSHSVCVMPQTSLLLMFSIRQFREAPIAVTNSDCPLAYEVLSLAIVDEACPFNYVESRTKLRLVTVDDNECPAMKYVRVGERIGPPEVVLA